MIQIPFELLLEDPTYRKWLKAVPPQPQGSYRKPPWRVWVQRELHGKWAFKDFETYPKAFNWLVKNRQRFWDAALTCKVQQYRPPVVRRRHLEHPTPQFPEGVVTKHYWPGVPGHRWCGFCRRPTVFTYFSKHHAIGKTISYEKRCTVCGARDQFAKRYHTTLAPQIPWGRPEQRRARESYESC